MRDGVSSAEPRDVRAKANALPVLRVALLVGSVAAIAYGVTDGEALVVLTKGVRVCLECIGIA